MESVELQGLELEGSYARRDGYYADVNANIIDAEYVALGSGAVGDWYNAPADTLRLTLGKRFARSADLSTEIVAADESKPAQYTGEKSPGYVILNLRATITPQDGLLEGTAFRFGIENAFDMNYMPALATRPAPGRNLKFTVSKAF